MGLFQKVFGTTDETQITTYAAFWEWFSKNEKKFHDIVKKGNEIDTKFFTALAPKIGQLHNDISYVAGMYNDTTAELILTADGALENMVFVEAMVNSAPALAGWKFTAHKEAYPDDSFSIKMHELEFNKDKLSFYSNDDAEYPDEIDITIVHADYSPRNQKNIEQGTYIYLDNLLGELRSVTAIDNLRFSDQKTAAKELVPIEKLNDFLIWREKEFVEKYSAVRHNTENDQYAVLKAEMEDGSMLIATINSDLMRWEAKASHPWMVNLQLEFELNDEGIPSKETFKLLDDLEDDVLAQLISTDGYLNIGRETLGNTRTVFFACNDFRKPSLVFTAIAKKYSHAVSVTYEVFKDKYWTSLRKFSH